MKRLTKDIQTNDQARLIQTLASEIVNRANLAATMGYQFGTDRNLYQALGYKGANEITYEDYFAKYLRQDIAKAIIDRPVKATWQGDLHLIESDDDQETAFEKAWDSLEDQLSLKSKFSRVDRLQRIGSFGVLLLGLSDVKVSEDWAKDATINSKLMYVRPFSEKSAQIDSYEDDTKNKRYGLPKIYSITINNYDSGTTRMASTVSSITIRVHWSRVIHIVEDQLESEITGLPILESVFNRLMDLDKIIGGDAEMFWRGARPGYAGNLEKDRTMTSTQKEALKTQIDEYEHNLRRILMMDGINLNSLAQQIADPSSHVDIQLKMISTVTQIPLRILTGSERGQLASGQDADEWDAYVQSRREDHAEPHIIRLFANRLIELKILPKPTTGTYQVKWSDLYAKSEDEKVTIGLKRAQALQAYASNPVIQEVMPIEAFMEFCWGLDSDQLDLATEMVKAGVTGGIDEEQTSTQQTQEGQQQEEDILTQGGEGSGNFGHEGRPGEVGGSGGGGEEAGKEGGNFSEENTGTLDLERLKYMTIAHERRLVDEGYKPISQVLPNVTENDFWISTRAVFQPSSAQEFDEIKSPILHSPKSNSIYKISEGMLYRGSDHWGLVGTCAWTTPSDLMRGFGFGKVKLSDMKRKDAYLAKFINK